MSVLIKRAIDVWKQLVICFQGMIIDELIRAAMNYFHFQIILRYPTAALLTQPARQLTLTSQLVLLLLAVLTNTARQLPLLLTIAASHHHTTT